MQKTIINTENLKRIFGKGNLAFEALKGIDITINEGEIVAIMGPSGSGKSTLLNILGALDKPTEGSVTIDESVVSHTSESKLYKIRRQKLGFIFQTFYLVPTLDALENVLLPILPLGVKNEDKKRATELLQLVGLEEKIHNKPNQLSGGQMQRVAIARALILNPPIILADEPTGSLDSKMGNEILELIQKLNREENKTFIIVTHDRKVASIAHRIIYIRDGEISETPSVD